MIKHAMRTLAAGLAALALTVITTGAVAHGANVETVRVLHNGHPTRLLAPGADFSVVVTGLNGPLSSYCLGLASLQDRYGIPVGLGVFQASAGGTLSVRATIPFKVFPAEPPGPFLLFVGRCTDVAPDGNYGSETVFIVPALG